MMEEVAAELSVMASESKRQQGCVSLGVVHSGYMNEGASAEKKGRREEKGGSGSVV